MSISHMVENLHKKNIDLWFEGDRLRYRAPAGSLTQVDKDALLKNKTQILDFLKRQSANEIETHALSYAQQSLWFLNQAFPDSPAYNVAFTARISSTLDLNAFRLAFQALVDRHPMLRTSYFAENGVPYQRIFGFKEVDYIEIAATGWSEEKLHESVTDAYKKPFDLETDTMLRIHLFVVDPSDYVFLLTSHHIAVDGWSMWILLDELRTLYQNYATGKGLHLKRIESEYTHYVQWQEQILNSEKGERLWEYWKNQLGGHLPQLQFPNSSNRPSMHDFEGGSHVFYLNQNLFAKINQLARSEGVTLYTIMLAVYQVMIHRYTGQDDILVSSPIAGRSRPEFSDIVGCFVNPVVIRGKIKTGLTFRDFLQETRKIVLAALNNQDYPLPLLTKRLQPKRNMSNSPLFQVDFVLQKPHRSDDIIALFGTAVDSGVMDFAGLKLASYYIPQQQGQLDLSLELIEVNNTLCGNFKYRQSAFDAPTIARMHKHYTTLLTSIVDQPDQLVSDLPMISEKERNLLLYAWSRGNAEAAHQDLTAFRSIPEMVEQHAASKPEAIAVTCENDTINYADLNASANRLARYIIAKGVGVESLVGIYMHKSIDLIVSILGVLKAGGSYLPLDPTYPLNRIAFILEDSKAPLLLTNTSLSQELPQNTADILCLDRITESCACERRENIGSELDPDHLAYVIYTSGSTGKPKGVMIQHGSLTNAFSAWEEAFQLDSIRSHLQLASFSFDVFTGDFVRALCSGSRLILCPKHLLMDPENLFHLMQKCKVEFAEFVPAVLRELIRYLENQSLKLDFLKILACGSDTWTMSEYHKIKGFISSEARLINSYGTTEATIDSTFYESQIADTEDNMVVPIGRPFANMQTYILDTHLQPTPIGIPGELHIGGKGLARGYLNRSKLTSEKFVPNPFGKETGDRLYKTGDLARYRPNGNIELIGRMDYQVKIRGFRVEPGEIESLLEQFPGIDQSVVVVYGDDDDTKKLVAYYTTNVHAEVDFITLQKFLNTKLPDYMIPSFFCILDEFPLTPNGKINRTGLPDPTIKRSKLLQEYVAPATESEIIVADIWKSILGVDKISIHDTFFEVGGHSLLLTQLHSRLKEKFDINLTLRNLFEAITIKALGELIDALIWASKGELHQPKHDRVGREELQI